VRRKYLRKKNCHAHTKCNLLLILKKKSEVSTDIIHKGTNWKIPDPIQNSSRFQIYLLAKM
jgi:hypothetical protein